MSGLRGPEATAAYEAVRSDKDETNWLLISHGAGNKLELKQQGTGGLAALKEQLDDSQVQYGYVRIEYANDKESTRIKFVLITWIGDNTGVMRKARAGAESGEVKAILSHHSAITVSDKRELDLDEIVARLRKAGGADYNGGRG